MLLLEIPSPNKKDDKHVLAKSKQESQSQLVFVPTPKDRLLVASVSLVALVFCAILMFGAISILHAGIIGWLAILAIILFAVVTINTLMFLSSSHLKHFNERPRL